MWTARRSDTALNPVFAFRQAQTPRGGKEKKAPSVAERQVSLPRHANEADDLELVVKLHRVEKHIRKNKLKVPPSLMPQLCARI